MNRFDEKIQQIETQLNENPRGIQDVKRRRRVANDSGNKIKIQDVPKRFGGYLKNQMDGAVDLVQHGPKKLLNKGKEIGKDVIDTVTELPGAVTSVAKDLSQMKLGKPSLNINPKNIASGMSNTIAKYADAGVNKLKGATDSLAGTLDSIGSGEQMVNSGIIDGKKSSVLNKAQDTVSKSLAAADHFNPKSLPKNLAVQAMTDTAVNSLVPKQKTRSATKDMRSNKPSI